jgi:hypothetical protein
MLVVGILIEYPYRCVMLPEHFTCHQCSNLYPFTFSQQHINDNVLQLAKDYSGLFFIQNVWTTNIKGQREYSVGLSLSPSHVPLHQKERCWTSSYISFKITAMDQTISSEFCRIPKWPILHSKEPQFRRITG